MVSELQKISAPCCINLKQILDCFIAVSPKLTNNWMVSVQKITNFAVKAIKLFKENLFSFGFSSTKLAIAVK